MAVAAYWRATLVMTNPTILGTTDHDATLATLTDQLQAVIDASVYGEWWELTSLEIEPTLGIGDWVKASRDGEADEYARVVDSGGTNALEYGDGTIATIDHALERL